jgi:hypothetical protein
MSRERRRGLFMDEETTVEPGRYGCPMLIQSRQIIPTAATRPIMRCALGWALHNEVEVARCAATEAMTDCWKIHPERTPVVVLSTVDPERVREPAPIVTPTKVAGD